MLFQSSPGLEFLKRREDCKLKAYLDLGGIPTIGYGSLHLLNGMLVKLGDTITQKEADLLLAHECMGIVNRLTHLINVSLTQFQIDALTSFVYNIGVAAFRNSTIRLLINQDALIDEDEFTRWNKAHIDGKLVAVKGLTNRRKLEYQLFCGKDNSYDN